MSTPVLFAVEMKDIGHFRLLPLLLRKLCACLFHGPALLFFVKIVKRAFEFGDSLGNEVQIAEGGFYG